MDIQIIGVKFQTKNQFGDFLSMIKDNIEQNITSTLYIYNDDTDRRDCNTFHPSSGNACVRCYNIHNPKYKSKPYAIGMCTGTYTDGGFKTLSEDHRISINSDIERIKEHIRRFGIDCIYYSIDDDTGVFSQGNFTVSKKVRDYITKSIQELSCYKPSLIY